MSLKNKAKNINVQVISREGHTDLELDRVEAVKKIQDLCNNEAKWLYIDGVHHPNMQTLGIDLLEDAEDITLTNRLAGGNWPAPTSLKEFVLLWTSCN